MNEDYLDDIDRMRHEIGSYAQTEQELMKCINDVCAEELETLQDLKWQIDELRLREEATKSAMRTKAQALFTDLETAQSRTKKAKEALKRYCHSQLPLSVLKDGLKVKDKNPVSVRVSKVQIERSYDAERLAADFPQLEDLYVDGDPVIGRTVVPEVLDRLIAQSKFSEADAIDYRIERKVKNPSVTIEVTFG